MNKMMENLKLLMKCVFTGMLAAFSCLMAQNQTETLSPVFSEDFLPFTLQIEKSSFSLPVGLQAYVSAIYKGKWILIAGRTNGLHGFANVGNNFPESYQNTFVYVIDPRTGNVSCRSLADQSSGLSPTEIDTLSVTSAQSFQKGAILYIVGGYGINSTTGEMETKSTLTALNLKGLMKWVEKGKPHVSKIMRQVADPLLQVTGGFLFQNSSHDPFLLMLGQNFTGLYTDSSNGAYTQQIRAFRLKDDGKNLSVIPQETTGIISDYRRRDLNIVPVIRRNKFAYVAFAGVFTLQSGVWTVPITIFPDGSSVESNPADPQTFKQAMNHYNCPSFGLYSAHAKEMYVVFPGGISYGFFSNGVFQTDSEIPFINQVTTVKIDSNDQYSQYLMTSEYPFIASTGTNPGNQLLFGASAQFFPASHIPLFRNGVIQLDKLPHKPIDIGYIVGGIMSTLPNTNTREDSTSSPYIFTVTLIPRYTY